MEPTRRPPALEVYEDPDAYNASSTDHDVETALLNALAPLPDALHERKMQLDPSTYTRPGSSPSKRQSSPMRPVSSHTLREYSLPPPSQPAFITDSPTKNADFYAIYRQVAPKLERTLYPQQQTSSQSYDQDSMFEGASFGDLTGMPYPDPDQAYKGPMKRGSADDLQVKPTASKKQKTAPEEPFDLPDPREMPMLADDGTKPQHSYAELIGMAILRAPNRRLTLAQIYKWISDNFAFYKGSEGGWQNSIRHNLSLNKNFIKQERPKDDPGKGNYWAIKPGEERPYLLGKKGPIRKLTNADGSQYIAGLSSEGSYYRSSTPAIGQFSLAPNPARKNETKVIDSARFPDESELSSDGTIPASDPALHEDDQDDAVVMPPPSTVVRSSPPPHDMGSSPPAFHPHSHGTPPPANPIPSSSRSRGGRRKFAGLNDSGYWSSIESSAARGAAQQLTSEANITRGSRNRSGRAETEIARLRSSSVGSPSKHRRNGSNPHFESSPALRDDNPLTPAVVFKRPMKPPPSVSPNTNLRNHRNRVKALLGSPANTYNPVAEPSIWSPGLIFAEDGPVGLTPVISPYKQSQTPWRPQSDDAGIYDVNNTAFDIFIDAPEEDMTARGSPEKRSSKRPSLTRAATSTGILADITGAAKSNSSLLAPTTTSPFSFSPSLAKLGSLRSPVKLGSPLKQSHKPPTPNYHSTADLNWLTTTGAENLQPMKHAHHNSDVAQLFGNEFGSDGYEEAIDIFQDFGKIGQSTAAATTQQHSLAHDRASGSPVQRSMGPPPRPAFGS